MMAEDKWPVFTDEKGGEIVSMRPGSMCKKIAII